MQSCKYGIHPVAEPVQVKVTTLFETEFHAVTLVECLYGITNKLIKKLLNKLISFSLLNVHVALYF